MNFQLRHPRWSELSAKCCDRHMRCAIPGNGTVLQQHSATAFCNRDSTLQRHSATVLCNGTLQWHSATALCIDPHRCILRPLSLLRQKGTSLVIDFTLDSQTINTMGIVGDRVIDVRLRRGEGYSIIVGTNAIQKLTRANSENSFALNIDLSLRKKVT